MSVLSVFFSLNTSHPNHTSFQIAPYPACIFLPPVWILWLYSTILFCCCFFLFTLLLLLLEISPLPILQSVLLGWRWTLRVYKMKCKLNEYDICVCWMFFYINRLPGTQYYIYIRFNYLLLRYFCSLNRIPFSFWGFCFFAIHLLSVVVPPCMVFHLHTFHPPTHAPHYSRFLSVHSFSIQPFSKWKNNNNRKVKFLFYLCDVFILIRLFFPFCSILLCNLLLPFEFFAVALHTILWIAVMCPTAFVQLFFMFFLHFVFGICYAFIDEKDRYLVTKVYE